MNKILKYIKYIIIIFILAFFIHNSGIYKTLLNLGTINKINEIIDEESSDVANEEKLNKYKVLNNQDEVKKLIFNINKDSKEISLNRLVEFCSTYAKTTLQHCLYKQLHFDVNKIYQTQSLQQLNEQLQGIIFNQLSLFTIKQIKEIKKLLDNFNKFSKTYTINSLLFLNTLNSIENLLNGRLKVDESILVDEVYNEFKPNNNKVNKEALTELSLLRANIYNYMAKNNINYELKTFQTYKRNDFNDIHLHEIQKNNLYFEQTLLNLYKFIIDEDPFAIFLLNSDIAQKYIKLKVTLFNILIRLEISSYLSHADLSANKLNIIGTNTSFITDNKLNFTKIQLEKILKDISEVFSEKNLNYR